MISFTLMFLGIPHIQSSTYFSTIMSIEYNKSKFKLHGAQLLMNLCHKKTSFVSYIFFLYIYYIQLLDRLWSLSSSKSTARASPKQPQFSTVQIRPSLSGQLPIRADATLANARAKCTCAHTSADGRQPWLTIAILRNPGSTFFARLL